MGKIHIAVVVFGLVGSLGWSENQIEPITLYQVGNNGRYCVSYTPDASGCISGTDKEGLPVNVMQLAVEGKVVFKNVSDAPHDMKFTGANAEDLPAQAPNAAEVEKGMKVPDPAKAKITCSFHGPQLEVGYKVEQAPVAQTGDIEIHGIKIEGANLAGNVPPPSVGFVDKITKTKLADVSDFMLAKAPGEDVLRLVEGRPELGSRLMQIRPLLAQELLGKGTGNLAGMPFGMPKVSLNVPKSQFAGMKTTAPGTVKGQVLGGADFSPSTSGGAGGFWSGRSKEANGNEAKQFAQAEDQRQEYVRPTQGEGSDSHTFKPILFDESIEKRTLIGRGEHQARGVMRGPQGSVSPLSAAFGAQSPWTSTATKWALMGIIAGLGAWGIGLFGKKSKKEETPESQPAREKNVIRIAKR